MNTTDYWNFYNLVIPRIVEIAQYQKLMCGKVKNLGKETQSNTDYTEINSSLTYMDMITQDYLMVPIFQAYPFLVPLVEEYTGMKTSYKDNQSKYTLIIDPIDGTSVYCKGEKDYSIMVGLLDNGKLVVGIGCYPESGEIYAAIKGAGAWIIDKEGNKTKLQPLHSIKHNSKNIAVHYRFLEKPFDVLSKKLTEMGYTMPTNKTDFGTNLTGIMRIVNGESCAFIGPHITLHDFGVPSLIVEELGGVLRVFDYQGKQDVINWTTTDNVFKNLDPTANTPRFRIIIANSDETVARILVDMY